MYKFAIFVTLLVISSNHLADSRRGRIQSQTVIGHASRVCEPVYEQQRYRDYQSDEDDGNDDGDDDIRDDRHYSLQNKVDGTSEFSGDLSDEGLDEFRLEKIVKTGHSKTRGQNHVLVFDVSGKGGKKNWKPKKPARNGPKYQSIGPVSGVHDRNINGNFNKLGNRRKHVESTLINDGYRVASSIDDHDQRKIDGSDSDDDARRSLEVNERFSGDAFGSPGAKWNPPPYFGYRMDTDTNINVNRNVIGNNERDKTDNNVVSSKSNDEHRVPSSIVHDGQRKIDGFDRDDARRSLEVNERFSGDAFGSPGAKWDPPPYFGYRMDTDTNINVNRNVIGNNEGDKTDNNDVSSKYNEDIGERGNQNLRPIEDTDSAHLKGGKKSSKSNKAQDERGARGRKNKKKKRPRVNVLLESEISVGQRESNNSGNEPLSESSIERTTGIVEVDEFGKLSVTDDPTIVAEIEKENKLVTRDAITVLETSDPSKFSGETVVHSDNTRKDVDDDDNNDEKRVEKPRSDKTGNRENLEITEGDEKSVNENYNGNFNENSNANNSPAESVGKKISDSNGRKGSRPPYENLNIKYRRSDDRARHSRRRKNFRPTENSNTNSNVNVNVNQISPELRQLAENRPAIPTSEKTWSRRSRVSETRDRRRSMNLNKNSNTNVNGVGGGNKLKAVKTVPDANGRSAIRQYPRGKDRNKSMNAPSNIEDDDDDDVDVDDGADGGKIRMKNADDANFNSNSNVNTNINDNSIGSNVDGNNRRSSLDHKPNSNQMRMDAVLKKQRAARQDDDDDDDGDYRRQRLHKRHDDLAYSDE